MILHMVVPGFPLYQRSVSLAYVCRRYISIDHLISAANSLNSERERSTKENGPDEHRTSTRIDLRGLLITPQHLLDEFRADGVMKPSKEEIYKSQVFFNSAKSKLDWSCADYDHIPDVKYMLLKNENIRELDDQERSKSAEVLSKKTFGVAPSLLKPLPEVLILGHTNVGKSSLINNLLVNSAENKSSSSFTEHAYISKKAGYTKTLNCYNVGNKIRIVDSPGYGRFGDESQGKFVVDYISQRDRLRKVLVLIDSFAGSRQEDHQLIQLLLEEGVSFDIVFTKTDTVVSKYAPKKLFSKKKHSTKTRSRDVTHELSEANSRIREHFHRLISEMGLYELASLPTIFFNNTYTNQFVVKRYGYKAIRHSILESCSFFSKISLK